MNLKKVNTEKTPPTSTMSKEEFDMRKQIFMANLRRSTTKRPHFQQPHMKMKTNPVLHAVPTNRVFII